MRCPRQELILQLVAHGDIADDDDAALHSVALHSVALHQRLPAPLEGAETAAPIGERKVQRAEIATQCPLAWSMFGGQRTPIYIERSDGRFGAAEHLRIRRVGP